MKTKAYAARLKNRDELLKSSSGGAFTAFSDYFLENNGAVISPVYNYSTNQLEFLLYTDKNTRNLARGSKYVQANMGDIFNEIKNWVHNNDGKALFIGTGCQADGFRKYSEMEGFRDSVLIVDIICHGTPSPKIWKDYIAGEITYVSFKDKRNGWNSPYAYIEKNGKEIDIQEYDKLFYGHWALRPSCYECKYSMTERKVDITIGDFWGIEKVLPNFYSQDGNSVVLVHTEKGMELLNKTQKAFFIQEVEISDCLQPNLVQPTKRPENREEFWKDYYQSGIKKVIKKYVRKPLWKKGLLFGRKVIKKYLEK